MSRDAVKIIQAAAGNAGGSGEALFYPTSSETDKTATWTVPDGVTSVSVVVLAPAPLAMMAS